MPLFARKPAEDHHGPLAEFVALRAEVLLRIEVQWKATTFQITTAGAVFGFALSSTGRMPLLLIIPFSSYILFTRWLRNARLVGRVSRYIRTELDGRIPGGVGYEAWATGLASGSAVRRAVVAAWQNPTALTFPFLSVLSLVTVAFWFTTVKRTWPAAVGAAGITAWSVGVLLTLLSGYLLWREQVRSSRDGWS